MVENKALRMSSYREQILKYGNPVSKSEYERLRSYAEENEIRLSCFKEFVGDINIIMQVIDDIRVVAKDFPKIIGKKTGIVLELDYNMGIDYATTVDRHVIHLNGAYYSDINVLTDDYNSCVADGRFVRGTDWHSVIFHETGHVVANLYHLDSMEIAKRVLNLEKRLQVLEILTEELSLYSTENSDGSEIISECFSGYYGHSDNCFARLFLEECKRTVKEDD